MQTQLLVLINWELSLSAKEQRQLWELQKEVKMLYGGDFFKFFRQFSYVSWVSLAQFSHCLTSWCLFRWYIDFLLPNCLTFCFSFLLFPIFTLLIFLFTISLGSCCLSLFGANSWPILLNQLEEDGWIGPMDLALLLRDWKLAEYKSLLSYSFKIDVFFIISKCIRSPSSAILSFLIVFQFAC